VLPYKAFDFTVIFHWNCLVNLTTVCDVIPDSKVSCVDVDRNLDSPCYNSKMVYSVLHSIYGAWIQNISFSSCNCQGKCGFSSPRNFGFYFLFFLFVMLHDTMIGCWSFWFNLCNNQNLFIWMNIIIFLTEINAMINI
jgi:hypothetical protein